MTAEGVILFNNIIGGKGDIFDVESDLFDREFNRYILFLNFVNLNTFGNNYFKQFNTKRVKYKYKRFIDLQLFFFFGRIYYRKNYNTIRYNSIKR